LKLNIIIHSIPEIKLHTSLYALSEKTVLYTSQLTVI